MIPALHILVRSKPRLAQACPLNSNGRRQGAVSRRHRFSAAAVPEPALALSALLAVPVATTLVRAVVLPILVGVVIVRVAGPAQRNAVEHHAPHVSVYLAPGCGGTLGQLTTRFAGVEHQQHAIFLGSQDARV